MKCRIRCSQKCCVTGSIKILPLFITPGVREEEEELGSLIQKKDVLLQIAKWVSLKRNSKKNQADLIWALKCLEVASYAHVSTSEPRALHVPGQIFAVHAQRYSRCLEERQN